MTLTSPRTGAADAGSPEVVLALLPLVSRIASDLQRAENAAQTLCDEQPASATARKDKKMLNRFLNELDNVEATLASYHAVRADFAARMSSKAERPAIRSRGMLRAQAG